MLYITQAAKVKEKKANINNMLETMKILNKTLIKKSSCYFIKIFKFYLFIEFIFNININVIYNTSCKSCCKECKH